MLPRNFRRRNADVSQVDEAQVVERHTWRDLAALLLDAVIQVARAVRVVCNLIDYFYTE